MAIAGKEKLLVTGAEGKSVIELITLFYQSSNEGKELDARITAGNPWYTTAGILDQAPRYHKKKISKTEMK